MACYRSLSETVHEIMGPTWPYRPYLTFDRHKAMIGCVATAHTCCMKRCECSQVPFALALLPAPLRSCHLSSCLRNYKMTLSLANLSKMYYTITSAFKYRSKTLKVGITFALAPSSTTHQTSMFTWKGQFWLQPIAGFTHHGEDQCSLHNVRRHTQTHQPKATQLYSKMQH